MCLGQLKLVFLPAAIVGISLASGTEAWAAAADRHEPHSLSADVIQKKRAQIGKEIARLKVEQHDAKDSADAKQIAGDLRWLRSLDALYAQRLAALADKRDLESQITYEKQELQSLEVFRPDEPKPYSFLLLECLQDQFAAERDHERALKIALTAAEQLLKAAHQDLDSVDRSAAASSTDKKNDSSSLAEGAEETKWGTANRPLVFARAKVGIKQAEVEVNRRRLDLSQIKLKQLDKKIDVVGKDVSFKPYDLDQQLGRLAGLETEVKRRRETLDLKFQDLEARKTAELAELAERNAPAAKIELRKSSWRTTVETIQAEIVVLDQRLEDLKTLRQFWRRRFELSNKSVGRQLLSEWLDENEKFADHLKDESQSLTHQIEIAHVAAPELAEGDARQDIPRWTQFELEQSQDLRDLCEATLLEIKNTQLSIDRFQQEIARQLKKTAGPLEDLRRSLQSLLGLEIAGTKDETVTVGRLVLLLIVLIVGIYLSYRVSRFIAKRVLQRIGLSRGKAVAVRSIIFYLLCLTCGVLAFHVLHIPLAAFAFVGGAAAIAVGFGSQDIMNNFMSGLILLTEQPIRVGDVINLSDIEGAVVHIGMRSTRLRTQANHELIVPNKSLLDEQVTNYTLSDNVVRRSVTMTVDRAVPIQRAKQLILEVTKAQKLVLETPQPVVLVKEIDNYYGSTTFEVFFALHLNSFMECAIVQSTILEQIGELFPPAKNESTPAADHAEDSAESSNGVVADMGDDKLGKTAVAKLLKKMQTRMAEK